MKVSQYLIERKNPETGYTERLVYTGTLRNKPTGWKVVLKITGVLKTW